MLEQPVGAERLALDAAQELALEGALRAAGRFQLYPYNKTTVQQLDRALKDYQQAIKGRGDYQKRWEAAQREMNTPNHVSITLDGLDEMEPPC